MNWRNLLIRLLQHLLRELDKGYSAPCSGEIAGSNPEIRKLSREDVLQLVESNGGPEGLDLSGADLSGANLDGLDLHGVVLGHYNPQLPRTNLEGARLVRANLQEAKLLRVNFDRAHMYLADLRGTDLRWSNLSHANLYGADVRGANLYRAKLYGTDLWEARLEEADLYLAFFDDHTHLSRTSLGGSLLQENPNLYQSFVEHNVVPNSHNPLETHLGDRHIKASEIYLRLKSVFSGAGRYEDASWAYFKQRQMARIASAPWRAHRNHGRMFLAGSKPGLLRWAQFYIQHTAKWLLDLGAELSCGYGERPLRTIVGAAIILTVFPLLYVWSGGIASAKGSMTWLDFFNYSFASFATIGFSQFGPTTPLAQTLTSIEALLGIAVLALLMFVLGNRISRS